ncbi:hypothetical protein [Massilia antarctica]|uniref:hypothetical protein n=1 Tax=Massilia antarctica TaxID=2765360 RepID=UPI0006BB70A9|nr:hypothetical protein [Massilia sp. H27-R4]MCY0910754.1 hypothetical protein [Massilia sp. H27-R4]CUI08866.1 hypothetical protein BN2497_12509 [Janthinobacterium sp. CG23_2]CUU32652.1 hypothetical protein BN3177_12509 [Janthinobacterium sp. CG23_2]
MSYINLAIETHRSVFTQAHGLVQRMFHAAPAAPAPLQARASAPDQIAFHGAMQANSLPCPRVSALYNCPGRTIDGARSLHSAADARRYLSDAAVYPLLFVPVSDDGGAQTFSAISIDKSSDAAVLGNGALIALADLVRLLELPCARGYLLQELTSPHRHGGLLVTVAMSAHGPHILRAAWKRAGVDADIPVPLWKAASRIVLAGAALYPSLKTQHWDIALCARGPLALGVSAAQAHAF